MPKPAMVLPEGEVAFPSKTNAVAPQLDNGVPSSTETSPKTCPPSAAPTPHQSMPWSFAKRSLSCEWTSNVGSSHQMQGSELDLKDVGELSTKAMDDKHRDAAETNMVLASSIDSMAKLGLRSNVSSMVDLSCMTAPSRSFETPPPSSAALEIRAILQRCPPPKRPKSEHAKPSAATIHSLDLDF